MIVCEDPERFERFVLPEPNSGCWLWTGGIQSAGYGVFNGRSSMYLAHRLSFMMHRGEIPEGLQIDHLCRTRSCVNPDHLELVTCAENLRRKPWKPDRKTFMTHCCRGHEFAGDNLLIDKKTGRRLCRECNRIRNRAFKASKRAA